MSKWFSFDEVSDLKKSRGDRWAAVLLGVVVLALALLLNHLHAKSARAQTKADAKQETGPMNHLAGSTSPYLLQHAHNPVDWYPWGPEALEKAKRENKPIFLSVGYSACHWCHVMEREDFENAAIAKALNADFVCIKVDREERPDIDDQYQMAVQLLTKSGGWPMSVWLTPDLKPFYAGTYYPAADFGPLLAKIANFWKQHPDKITMSAEEVATQMQALTDAMTRKATASLSPDVVSHAIAVLFSEYDKTHGGFGSKPKFPEAPRLMFLLDQYRLKRRADLLPVLSTTLDNMACGGIYDQVGGGFHRYSTDEKWLIPHFEKMLYDQALLALVYLDAYELLKKPLYKQVAQGTLDFVLREMTDPTTGGFYSSRDADSEGEEGKYYVWTLPQLRDVLGKADGDRFAQTYGVNGEGNFQDDKSVLHLANPLSEAQKTSDAPLLARLLAERGKRVAPTVDDKVVVSLNGLMIAAMARGYKVTGDQRYRTAAERAASLVAKTLTNPDGTLLHEARAGKAGSVPAFLEDYAFLTDGLITLYDATGDASWLRQAESASNQMSRLFWDKKGESGFLSDGPAGAPVAHRRNGEDNATPSANGIAAQDLLRLAALPAATGVRPQPETARLRKEAASTVEAFQPLLDRAPQGFPTLLVAYRMLHTPQPSMGKKP